MDYDKMFFAQEEREEVELKEESVKVTFYAELTSEIKVPLLEEWEDHDDVEREVYQGESTCQDWQERIDEAVKDKLPLPDNAWRRITDLKELPTGWILVKKVNKVNRNVSYEAVNNKDITSYEHYDYYWQAICPVSYELSNKDGYDTDYSPKN